MPVVPMREADKVRSLVRDQALSSTHYSHTLHFHASLQPLQPIVWD
jgi:hypothetical protein